MSHRATWLLLAVLPLLAGPALADPVLYGQQLCVMLKGGISQEKAWRYIAANHTKAAMANPQLLVPWFSAASAGWAVGTAWANAEQAQSDLAAMRPDVLKVARSICPQQFR